MKRRKKDLLHQRSAHIVSCDFRSLPAYVWENANVDKDAYCKLPFIRLENPNRLLLNESHSKLEKYLSCMCTLDMLPDQVLKDLYGLYSTICTGVTFDTIKGNSDTETVRNIFYIILPEVLWCRGDTTVKGMIFSEE